MNLLLRSTTTLALYILCTLSTLASLPAYAELLCPQGQIYRSDLCYTVDRKQVDDVEVYPTGKSYKDDQTMVGKEQADGTMRICPKGKSYRSDLCWVMR